jgi:hypothetical protein
MQTINDWSNSGEVQLNSEKTQIMSTGKIIINEITINELKIKTINKLKYLGVVLDSKLLWKEHLLHSFSLINS